jgi:hypothetical protein
LITLEAANGKGVQNLYNQFSLAYEKEFFVRHLELLQGNLGTVDPQLGSVMTAVLTGKEDSDERWHQYLAANAARIGYHFSSHSKKTGDPETSLGKYDLEDDPPFPGNALPVKRSVSQNIKSGSHSIVMYTISAKKPIPGESARTHQTQPSETDLSSERQQSAPVSQNLIHSPQLLGTQTTPVNGYSTTQSGMFGQLNNITLSTTTSKLSRFTSKKPFVVSYDQDATNDFLDQKYRELLDVQDEVVIEREVVRYISPDEGIADQYVEVLKNEDRRVTRAVSMVRNRTISYKK